jgi:hypothetical protein
MPLLAASAPVSTTLKHWNPKCNSDLERRLRLQFEVPLTEDLIAALSDNLRRAAEGLANIPDGVTETTISTTFAQTLEFYPLPEAKGPEMVLGNVLLVGLHLYRPEPEEGPSGTVFLKFSTTVRAEESFGDRLVCWALRNLHGEVFLKCFDVQGELPLEKAA